MYQATELSERSLSLLEPACPLCFEPFDTEAPDEDSPPEDGGGDRRPVLSASGRSVCACCDAEGTARRSRRHARRGLRDSTATDFACMAAPIDYNLINNIILQQHRRAACVPHMHEQSLCHLMDSLTSESDMSLTSGNLFWCSPSTLEASTTDSPR